MGFFTDKLTFLGQKNTITEIKDVSCLDFDKDFCDVLLNAMYSKIILECADRTVLTNDIEKSGYTQTVYDSYSPKKSGLASWVVYAITYQQKVYLKKLKIKGDIYIFKRVTQSEALKDKSLREDSIELDFLSFKEAVVIRLLFSLLQQIMIAMSKGITASQALVLKINALSGMIANSENIKALEEQIKQINNGLKNGKAGYIDAKSSIDFLTYDSTNTEKAAKYIFSLISTITGLPSSYLFGEVISGLGGGDNGDAVRFDSAIKPYFYNVWSGILYNVYNQSLEFKKSPEDVEKLITLFTFIETSTALTDAGKLKFMINNTSFNEEDFTYSTLQNEQKDN